MDETERKIIERMDKAHSRRPKRGDWGAFIYDDGPVICGGGVGVFFWFESKKTGLDFILEYAIEKIDKDHVGDVPTRDEISYFVKSLYNMSSERLRTRLNEYTQNLFQVEWIGPYSLLLAGEGDFESEVRDWYRNPKGYRGIHGIDFGDFAIVEQQDSSVGIFSIEERGFSRCLEFYGL